MWLVIKMLLDREEGRFDQVADCADRLCARLGKYDAFSSVLCESALLEDCGARNNWVTRFCFLCAKNP